MRAKLIFFLLLLSYAGLAQINGSTPVNVGTNQNYTFSNGIVYAEWYWEATGGTVVTEDLVGTQYQVTVNWTTVSSSNTIKLFRVTYNIHGAPVHTQIATKTIDVQLPVPAASTSTTYNCGNTVVTRSNSPASSLYEWWWQTDAAGTSTELGNGASITLTTAQPLYLRSRLTSSPNTWSTTLQSIGSISVTGASAQPVGLADEVIYGQGSITLQATPQGGNQVRWYTAPTGGTHFQTGNSYITPTLTASTKYYITTYNTTTLCESPVRTVITVTVAPLVTPLQITTEAVRVSGITTEIQMTSLTNTQLSKQFSYFDGMGRTFQTVAMATSPLGYDVVQPVVYDANGRSSIRHLPYVATTTTGALQTNFSTQQPAFYQAANDKIANDTKPYAAAVFENSPLGRVVEAGNVGDGYQPTQGHSKLTTYTFNTSADNVRKFKTDGSSTAFYAANKLRKTLLTDEDSKQLIVFADDLGRTVLKRTQLDETIGGQTVNWLDTYYVYDDFGREKYTISPKGVAALQGNSWSLTQAIKDDYVYENKYDVRGRIIEKKVPGQAWTYYVYNSLDQLVLMQDGKLRATNQWLNFKYDIKGRMTTQSLYTNAVNVTRAAVQTLADNNGTFALNQDNTPLKTLSVTYYDHYDFDNSGTGDYSYSVQGLTGTSPQQTTVNEATQASAYGRVTGSKRLNLATDTWLYTYIFYDKYGRAIQVRSDNHVWAYKEDLVTNLYDFEGKLVLRKTFHKTGSTSDKQVTVLNKYEYDTRGRLIKVYQNNNSAPSYQLVAKYEYDELGQLVDKKLHGTGTVGNETFLQSVDFRYTIRGQLATINDPQLATNANNDDTNDYFGMELLYDLTESGLNTALYNGNISALKWKGAGATVGALDQKSYVYAYDKSNKLETATYQMRGASTWDKEANTCNETMSYDHNGNMVSLQRKQNQPGLALVSGVPTVTSTAQLMDDLAYTYTVGNQLSKVEDASAIATGFNNASTAATEYTYDMNGNVTADLNKGINAVAYNFLGKPTQITFSDGRVITYVYDAAGVKLSMGVTVSGVTTTTDYVNNFVYEGGVLKFFGSPEGRVVKNGSNLEYQYSIADHQGNTRVVFTSAQQSPVATTATFEGDANDQSSQFTNVTTVSFSAANHTAGGVKVVRLNQSTPAGPALSKKVYPGDQVAMEAWSYYEATSGYGTTNAPLTNMITAIAGAFGGVSGGGGESGLKYTGVNTALNNFGVGANQGDTKPAAFLNYILFDQNYKVMNAGWQLITHTTASKQQVSIPAITVKEAGYIFVYLSYESQSNNYVYFDDFKVTVTPTNVVQYNEYYPFGLQTADSWTRDNNSNAFLYNAGNELNSTTQWYEMYYRGYDPALGRMLQVDPCARSFASTTPYNYALSNPALINDPNGGFAFPARATIQYKMNWIRDFGTRGVEDWDAELQDYLRMFGSFVSDGGGEVGGGGGGHGRRRSWFSNSTPRVYNRWAVPSEGDPMYEDAYDILAWDPTYQNAAYRASAQKAVDEFEQQTGGCPMGNCDDWVLQKSDKNGSKWYYNKTDNHHLGLLVEVTTEGKVIQHDVYGENMSEGLKRVFLEAFPIFKTEEGQQLAEDTGESIIEWLFRWPYPLPFYLPPDPPKFEPGPMSITPKLGPK